MDFELLGARPLLAAGPVAPVELAASYDTLYGSPAERFFLESMLKAGLAELSTEHWPCDVAELVDSPAVVYRDRDEVVYRAEDGTLALVRLGYDSMRVRVAAPTREAVTETLSAFKGQYPATYLAVTDARVPITFWTNSPHGPIQRLRMVDASPWEAITGNYGSEVRRQLNGMMDGFAPGRDGQLVLWQGEPGTGKTWALRALVSEWSGWAEFHYITDPDAFFVTDPSYMVSVLLADSYSAVEPDSGDVYQEEDPGGKWRVLILEDTGELLGVNSKQSYGQGLSRLLNVVDGMIGQGLRVLVLVTTNDELGELHPAVARPGRCAVQIEFGPLDADEASDWLGEDTGPGTLAELYSRRAVEAELAELAQTPLDDLTLKEV